MVFSDSVPKTKDRPSLVKRCYSLPGPMTVWIMESARRLGIGEAELVRRAMDEYRERHSYPREESARKTH